MSYLADHHPAGEQVAAWMGTRIGWLLRVLKQGNAAQRALRPDWDDADWALWGGIERVILSGGLLAGHLGRKLLPYVQPILSADASPRVDLSPYGAATALVGLSRLSGEMDNQPALVFDFGQTAVKRARADYTSDGACLTLKRLPSLPALQLPPQISAQVLLTHMLEIVAMTYAQAKLSAPALHCPISIASYVTDGNPEDRSQYGRLCELTQGETVEQLLTAELSRHLKREISVRLMHDGTSAAGAFAGSPNTAVITFGTAMGIGFAPPIATRRDFASNWQLIDVNPAANP